MKKLGVIIFVILLLVVGGLGYLWYLGAPKISGNKQNLATVAETNLSQPVIRPATDKNSNEINDWEEKFDKDEQAISLVLEALKKKREPLLPMETLPILSNRIYQLSDLRLTNQTDELSLIDYSKKLTEIMSVYREPGLGNEITLISGIANGDNDRQKILPEIIKSASRYNLSVNKLLALPVPASAGQIHLNLINGLARLAENAWLMTQINEEPMLAFGAAQLQTSRLRQILPTIGNINLFFAGHNLGLENNKEVIIAIDL